MSYTKISVISRTPSDFIDATPSAVVLLSATLSHAKSAHSPHPGQREGARKKIEWLQPFFYSKSVALVLMTSILFLSFRTNWPVLGGIFAMSFAISMMIETIVKSLGDKTSTICV